MSFPLYTHLLKVPSRGLPAELRKMEDSAEHRTRQDMFEMELANSSLLPKTDAPVLTIFVSDGSNLVLNPLGDGVQCVHVFSERWRAVDYARMRLASQPGLSFAVLSPDGFVKLLRDCEKMAKFAFTIDCCPRCEAFTPYDSTLADDGAYLVQMIGVHKSTEMARRHLYYHYALQKARAGHHVAARDVLLESVGHVTMADPDTHLLLGQLGVAMNDPGLVREAHEFLRFFGSGAWDRKLDQVEMIGKADFEGPEKG
ncbi:MAG TPA: hypothetical protein VJS69_02855 [Candidatus Krumholzibacteria bacterium]|nr:hypothetical protein [Candidatus Krumholzibacteria bacterium]